jgi:hypothetical protein
MQEHSFYYYSNTMPQRRNQSTRSRRKIRPISFIAIASFSLDVLRYRLVVSVAHHKLYTPRFFVGSRICNCVTRTTRAAYWTQCPVVPQFPTALIAHCKLVVAIDARQLY